MVWRLTAQYCVNNELQIRETGLPSARQAVARDIFELRRVYPDVPNSQLKTLIEMKKQMYPAVGVKP